MNSGDPAGAVARLAAAVAADPRATPSTTTLYADALWKAGTGRRRSRARAEAARLDPRQQVQYARSSTSPGGPPRRPASTRPILAANPDADDGPGRSSDGCSSGPGDYANAAPHLQLAVQLRPDDPVLQQELAYSLEQAGRTGRGRRRLPARC